MVAMIFLLAVLAFLPELIFSTDVSWPGYSNWTTAVRLPAIPTMTASTGCRPPKRSCSATISRPSPVPVRSSAQSSPPAAFGWGPTLLWVVLGAVFIGGIHDFSALVASIRHKARSVAEIARETMSPLAYKLLLSFIWLTLVYVLVVFTDLTSSTFVMDGGVATSSILFIALALGFGVSVYRLKIGVRWASILFVPLVFAAVWAGRLSSDAGIHGPCLLLVRRPGQDLGCLPDLLLFCRLDHAGLDPAPAPGLSFIVPALRFGTGGLIGILWGDSASDFRP